MSEISLTKILIIHTV